MEAGRVLREVRDTWCVEIGGVDRRFWPRTCESEKFKSSRRPSNRRL